MRIPYAYLKQQTWGRCYICYNCYVSVLCRSCSNCSRWASFAATFQTQPGQFRACIKPHRHCFAQNDVKNLV
jgi:predicted RNA-binding protein with PUA domain